MTEFEDHAMLTLAIKRRGKKVDAEHVYKKVNRDSESELSLSDAKELLDSLIARGLVDEEDGKYAITKKGRRWFEGRWREMKDDLNVSYLKVYRAKLYYPHVIDGLLDFCTRRKVSVFRIFTNRSWLQRKLGKNYIRVESEKDVKKWVNMHGIDFIPYICREGKKRPDWFIVDLDAGKEISFDKTKETTSLAFEILEEFGLKPEIKFSGSRGFQIWSKFSPHDIPSKYEPIELKTKERKRNFFSFYSDLVRYLEHELRERSGLPTTCQVADKKARKDKILFDPSIYKPFGDIRAPYSIHFKTGLVSTPISLEEMGDFVSENADPDKVAARYRDKGKEFKMEATDASEFFEEAVKWTRHSHFI